MSWPAFARIPNGTQISNNGYDQCVALANHYHEGTLGLPFVPVDSAYEWWTRFDEFPQLRDKYVRSQTPVPGALFVARGGLYDLPNGHIGVVTDVRSGGFSTMEQNTGPDTPQRYVYRHFRVKDDNVLGFLIPNTNPATEEIEVPLVYISRDTTKRKKAKQKIQEGSPQFIEHGDSSTAISDGAGDHWGTGEIHLSGKPGTEVDVVCERYVWDGKKYTSRVHITRYEPIVLDPEGNGFTAVPVSNRVPAGGAKLGLLATVKKGGGTITVDRFAAKLHKQTV